MGRQKKQFYFTNKVERVRCQQPLRLMQVKGEISEIEKEAAELERVEARLLS